MHKWVYLTVLMIYRSYARYFEVSLTTHNVFRGYVLRVKEYNQFLCFLMYQISLKIVASTEKIKF